MIKSELNVTIWKRIGRVSSHIHSILTVLLAYLFIAYAIIGVERTSQHFASLDLKALCSDEAGQHTPDRTPLSGHQHDAMCCLSGEDNTSLAILAAVPSLCAFGSISFLVTPSLDVGQPAGFPPSAYAQSRAPPSLG